ncbi:DUF5689 domain-containing protein [Paracrocinitomix mangrovi]|uniref:DUF5689 domain-containing protein n=1 Tax=Paracrocinitomix mangrovi TaxID=2862509 RepID=UPI001C8EA98D|nr:DUF5689 domain-containing protein [Paracrocinitomix mangrovi]UKN02094.1 DUF5689 domain-containing protein [Paracrocinitomix mangrovi]
MKKLLILSGIVLATASCKKYDTPPIEYPGEGVNVTIDSLVDIFMANGPMSIDTEMDLYGVVTMDENDGNIYKNVYLQDHTRAINVRLLNSGGIYAGDSVRIALKGCYINQYSGVMQLDSVNVDWNVVKISTQNHLDPEVVSIDQITAAKESELIKIENVQFVSWQLDETYAIADDNNPQSKDVLLEDQNGNTVVVRTSGYASFADQQVAQGSGSIICIVSHFNGEVQLYIRSYNEIDMNGARFNGLLHNKDFNDDEVNSGGWTTYDVISPTAAVWETSSAGGAPNPYVQISNYNGSGNDATDSWLISPAIDLPSGSTPSLSFDNAYNYSGPALEVHISTNYVSGDPGSATWTDLSGSAIWSGGSWVFVNSGDIDLSAYAGSTVHIAFRYQGTASTGSTWELDNILIKG